MHYIDDIHSRFDFEEISEGRSKKDILHEWHRDGILVGGEEIENELKKTNEEIKMIEFIIGYLQAEYLGTSKNKKFELHLGNIHIIDNETGGKGGFSFNQYPSCIVPRSISPMENFVFIAHELVHLYSYRAVELGGYPANWGYRSGLTLDSNKRGATYFRIFDEAITENIALNILEKAIMDLPNLFTRDRELLKKSGQVLDIKYLAENGIAGVREVVIDGERKIAANDTPYEREQNLFVDFCHKLANGIAATKGMEITLAQKMVRDLFFLAKFSGKIFPLGILVDQTFGKGTFTKLAQVSNNLNIRSTSLNMRNSGDKRIECDRMETFIAQLPNYSAS